MWTRRELMAGSVMGNVWPAFQAERTQAETLDREALKGVTDELRGIKEALTTLADGADLPAAIVSKLRDQMSMFLRANGKFPDFFDVGQSVFYQVYDWHVKNAHPLVVGRQPDGRYALQFMFSRLILRPESDANYVGAPYDNR